MASQAQAKVQNAVSTMMENLEKESLRPLQKNSHLCCASCCDRKLASKEQLESCMQNCFRPAQQVQEYISKELNGFQDRLSRCAKRCQDDIQDQMDVNTTQAQLEPLQNQLDSCVVKCCDSHVELIPKMMERVNQILKQSNSSNTIMQD